MKLTGMGSMRVEKMKGQCERYGNGCRESLYRVLDSDDAENKWLNDN